MRNSSYTLVLSLIALCAASASGQVVINEIMYHPASENSREEYIELFNTSPTNVNLSGWRSRRTAILSWQRTEFRS